VFNTLLVGRSSSQGTVHVKENYEFGETLGQGAFGKVTVATCRDSGVRFACKSIPKALFANEGHRIRREVEVGLTLRGEAGVVALHETYEDGDFIHMLSELCQGGNLLQRLVRLPERRLAPHLAAALVDRVLHILSACHAKGVVHRDVKPSNFVLEQNELKIIDFGLATFWSPCTKLRNNMGTGSFVAPEVLSPGESYGPKCDVWSIGAMAFMLIYGRPPFFSKDLEEVKRRVQEEELVLGLVAEGEPLCSAAKTFLEGTLHRTVDERMSVKEALQHVWIVEGRCASHELTRVLSADSVERI